MFSLIVEQSRDPLANTAEQRLPTAYPSILSHLSSQQILHPMSVLIPRVPSPQFAALFSGIAALPCDIHLVNLRLLYQSISSTTPPQSALILHRKGYDCHYLPTAVTCSLTEGKVRHLSFMTC